MEEEAEEAEEAEVEADLISDEALDIYRPYFPTVERGQLIELPEEDLPQEDIEQGNLDAVVLHDAQGDLLGFGRTIFTPVGCSAGVCEAIRFTLVFDDDLAAFDVFHLPRTDHDFKKYWQDEYLTFDEVDLSQLRHMVQAPPEILIAASSQADLVEGTHGSAPTRPEFEDYVVRGAAFTCYLVIQYAVDTSALLGATVDEGAGA